MTYSGVSTTVHSDQRARKRLGTKDVTAYFEKAKELGFRQEDLRGTFAKLMARRSAEHKASFVIYKNHVFWYGKKDGILITVYQLDRRWHKYTKAMEARRNG